MGAGRHLCPMRSALILLALLAGCSTTGAELAQHEPRATYESSKQIPALEQCLGNALSWTGSPSVLRGDTETSITFNVQGQSLVRTTLRPTAAGTTVVVHQLVSYSDRVKRGVEGCL